MKILLENVSILPMTGHDSFIAKGHLVIDGDRIQAIGEGKAPEYHYDRIIDGRNRVALPGFINTHTHAAMTLLRGFADDMPLMQWLETKIWPMEARLTGEDMYWGSLLAIIEMIKSGTTTFNDMYFFMDQTARAAEESGIRAVLSRGLVGIGPESETGLKESREFIRKWHRKADERIHCMLGPHAPYTCPPDYLRKVIPIAEDTGVGIHIHIAETLGEVNDIRKQYQQTPVQLMESCGLFRIKTLAAHCVHLSDEDITILKDQQVGVAHNPESNMKLASGIARVPDMLAKGIPVSLGTDGASSNNNLDMLQEMRSCALLHKVNQMDPTVLPAYQALEMATVNGALALGLENEVGKLQPGLKADVILMNLTTANMVPVYDTMANIVYSAQAADVDTVIINGRVVMENREINTLPEEEILKQVNKIAQRLVKA